MAVTAAVPSSPRRSARTPKPVLTNLAPPKSPRRRARSASVDMDVDTEEDDKPAKRTRRKSPSPAPRARRAVTPRPPKVKVPIPGINSIPSLFPSYDKIFKFDIPVNPPTSISPRLPYVYGNGDFGQHGLGTDDSGMCEIKRPRPHAWFEEAATTQSEWSDGIANIVCGGMHTLAVDKFGRVWSWGINDNAALGRSTVARPATDTEPALDSEELETRPMLVEGLNPEEFKVVRVAAGDSVSLAISDLGEVRCWGSFRGSEGLLGFDGVEGHGRTQLVPVKLPNIDRHTITQVACGDDHFLALTSKGVVFACGNGEQNQLGRKIIHRHKTHGLTPESLGLRNIVLVGCGSFHSFAVNKNGKVFAWGLNSFRQTGVAEEDGGWADTIQSPTEVRALDPSKHDGARVVQICGGSHHTLFLFDNGKVFSCGRCDASECGLPTDHPAMLASEERKQEALDERKRMHIQEVETNEKGGMSSEEAAIKAAEAAAQGIPLPNPYIPEPTQLTFPNENDSEVESKIVFISSGSRHNFAVSREGRVFAWGYGNVSQLGLGDEEEAKIPTEVKSKKMTGQRVLEAHTGGQHSLVLTVTPRSEEEIETIVKEKAEAKANAQPGIVENVDGALEKSEKKPDDIPEEKEEENSEDQMETS